jgi:hypothetical protein
MEYLVHGYIQKINEKNQILMILQITDDEKLNYKSSVHISININNENIIVGNMSIDGIWNRYHYL